MNSRDGLRYNNFSQLYSYSYSCADLSNESESLVDANIILLFAESYCRNNSWIMDLSIMQGVSPNNCCCIFVPTAWVCSHL